MKSAVQPDKSDIASDVKSGDLYAHLELQSVKIQELLSRCETIGAETEELRREKERLSQKIEHLQREVASLDPWRALCQRRLGPDIGTAGHQLDIWWSHVEAMQSPGHRFVSFLGKTVGRGFLGRFIRRVLNLLIAIRKA